MAYIGKTPVIGNFQKCDSISVVNGQAAYTLQVGGVNVSPQSENHMLVSLNGILQAPVDSFTVSGSTLTFASNLVTGDVIDFVMILGNVLDLGVPSDNTVTTAKLASGVGLPPGMVAPFGMSSAPTGWLECDGSAISRTTYATLFTAVGTTHGVGDGSTTFNLPDLRGEFIRGWDNGKGTDSGRSFASSQAEEVGTHNHTYLIKDGSSGTGNIAGFPESTLQFWSNATSGTTQNNSGSENRPRNIALMYCIKT